MDKTHKEKHEKDVQSVINTIQSMVNPFDTTQPNLVHLASGVIAPAAIRHDLLSAKSLGEERFCVFVQENLSEKPDVFDTIQKTKKTSDLFFGSETNQDNHFERKRSFFEKLEKSLRTSVATCQERRCGHEDCFKLSPRSVSFEPCYCRW